MGFIREKYNNNRGGLIVAFLGDTASENYTPANSVEEALQYFDMYVENGEIWVSLYDNNGNPPAEGWWRRQEEEENEAAIADYVAGTTYNTGDQVLFEGQTYESLIDNNVWSPTAYPQGWQLIGDET